MSRQYDRIWLKTKDLRVNRDDNIVCPDPDCNGVFDDYEVLDQKAETIELELDCTHCHNVLYLCHEQPSSVMVKVPEDEQASPAFA